LKGGSLQESKTKRKTELQAEYGKMEETLVLRHDEFSGNGNLLQGLRRPSKKSKRFNRTGPWSGSNPGDIQRGVGKGGGIRGGLTKGKKGRKEDTPPNSEILIGMTSLFFGEG